MQQPSSNSRPPYTRESFLDAYRDFEIPEPPFPPLIANWDPSVVLMGTCVQRPLFMGEACVSSTVMMPPVTDLTDGVWYYCPEGSDSIGPVSLDDLKEYVSMDMLPANVKIHLKGDPNKWDLQSVLENRNKPHTPASAETMPPLETAPPQTQSQRSATSSGPQLRQTMPISTSSKKAWTREGAKSASDGNNKSPAADAQQAEKKADSSPKEKETISGRKDAAEGSKKTTPPEEKAETDETRKSKERNTKGKSPPPAKTSKSPPPKRGGGKQPAANDVPAVDEASEKVAPKVDSKKGKAKDQDKQQKDSSKDQPAAKKEKAPKKSKAQQNGTNSSSPVPEEAEQVAGSEEPAARPVWSSTPVALATNAPPPPVVPRTVPKESAPKGFVIPRQFGNAWNRRIGGQPVVAAAKDSDEHHVDAAAEAFPELQEEPVEAAKKSRNKRKPKKSAANVDGAAKEQEPKKEGNNSNKGQQQTKTPRGEQQQQQQETGTGRGGRGGRGGKRGGRLDQQLLNFKLPNPNAQAPADD